MTSPIEILKLKGPLLSSTLSNYLSDIDSININTASQRIARNDEIKKIKGFFVSNQSFCYLEEHKSDELLEKFMIALEENGKKYWYCINALKLHGGVISSKYLQCYTNYPVLPLKSHIPFNDVMQNFIKEDILIYNDNYYMFSPRFARQKVTLTSYQSIEMIKDNVLDHFNSLTKNIGLISYRTGENFAEYGKFRWAFKGVSYIGTRKNEVNTFLIADILIGSAYYEKDIEFFIQKLKHIRSFQNAPRILPFLIIDNVNKNALELLKQNGIVVALIGELFGQKYAETLSELINILNNAGASLKKTPEQYLNLIKQLRKYNEGLANNMKGTLFEFLVGHLHSINTNSSVDLGREIIEVNFRHEMDVLTSYPDKIVISECKAQNGKIGIEIIDKWLGVKVPAFKRWCSKQETWRNKSVEFEFWSTSGYTVEAISKLEQAFLNNGKYKVSFFDGKDIKEIAVKMKNKKMKEAIDGFFLKT